MTEGKRQQHQPEVKNYKKYVMRKLSYFALGNYATAAGCDA